MPVAAGPVPEAPLTEAVWAEFHVPVRRFVARRVSNPADVDDIVQHVFLRVHRGLQRQSGQIHAWLYRVAHNVIADHYRAPVRRREQARGDAIDFDALEKAEAESDRRAFAELARCLRPMIERLPSKHRDALVRAELDGLTQAEAARAHGLSRSGMKSRVQRARRGLRNAILECCRIELDRRGGVISYERRAPGCCRDARPQARGRETRSGEAVA